jgi:hypothetical protein
MRPGTLRKAAVVGVGVALGLVLLPVLEEIVVVGMLVLVAGVCLGLLAVGTTWRVARRHPLLGALVGAWLLDRHERRVHRVIDARSRPVWPPPPSQ